MSTPEEMDGLIDRALRGEARPDELAWLERWRRLSPENERLHARTIRLLEAARRLGEETAGSTAPAAAVVIERAESGSAPVALAPARARRAARARVWLPWGIAAAAVLALLLPRFGAAPAPDGGAVIRTGAAELATVELEDGSVVRLGPSSVLELEPFGERRGVALEGLAFFNVAEQPGRPFRVRTAVGEAVVLGTRFELQADADRLELLVVEGRVALTTGDDGVEVGGGERSGIVGGTVLQPRAVPNPDSALAWAGTFIVFRSTPLGEAAAEIERVYGVDVSVSESISGRTVTGTFVDRTPREVLDVLCSIGDVRCRFERDRTILTP